MVPMCFLDKKLVYRWRVSIIRFDEQFVANGYKPSYQTLLVQIVWVVPDIFYLRLNFEQPFVKVLFGPEFRSDSGAPEKMLIWISNIRRKTMEKGSFIDIVH